MSTAAVPNLPLPAELQALLDNQAQLHRSQQDHRDLLQRLDSLIQARKIGHNRMDVPVDLGMGYTIEGIVPDTESIIVSAGIQDLWLQMKVDAASIFVGKRLALVNKRVEALEPEIEQLRKEYALVAKTLRQALAPTADERGTDTEVMTKSAI